LTALLTQTQMNTWGWRIPFIIGFFLGAVSYIIRKKTIETPAFLALQTEKRLERQPFLTAWSTFHKKLFYTGLLTAATSSIIALFLYLPTYFVSFFKMDASHVYRINLINFLSLGLMTLLFGWISDRINREKLIIIGTSSLVLLSYPLFYGLNTFGESFVWIFSLGFSVFGGMVNGTYVVLITRSFQTHIRYSSVGFSFGIGVALFTGIAPLAFIWLIQVLNCMEAPAFYVYGCAALTLFATLAKTKEQWVTRRYLDMDEFNEWSIENEQAKTSVVETNKVVN
jgi:MFS family permease